MYGLPKKNFSSLILPIFMLLCFTFMIAEPAYAAKAPAPKTESNKAAVQSEASSQGHQEDDFTFEDEKKDTATQTEAAPKSDFDKIMDTAAGYVGGNRIIVYAIAGVIVLLIIIGIAVSGKKNKCQKCGSPIPAGETLCGLCSSQAIYTEMEANAGQIQPQQNAGQIAGASSQPLPQAGQLPNSAFTQNAQSSFESQISSQMAPPPAPAVSATAPGEKKKAKQRPTGRVIANLNMRKGPNPGYRFSLYDSQTQITIGRDEDCDFVIEDEEDKEIASRHATITIENQSIFTVHDISSAAGIQINGQRLQQAQLKTGDVIKIGKTELAFARL